jgi:hypothetical protein
MPGEVVGDCTGIKTPSTAGMRHCGRRGDGADMGRQRRDNGRDAGVRCHHNGGTPRAQQRRYNGGHRCPTSGTATANRHGEQQRMAVTVFVVHATITSDQEAAFNRWYNEEHAPQLLRYNGAVSARRYRKILGEDKYHYMAVYEFASEEVFRRFQDSDHLKELVAEYNANFGTTSQRTRSAWVQVWP